MERLNALTVDRLSDLALRLFTENKPTVVALGPVAHVPGQAEIADILGAGIAQAAQ